MSNQLNNFLFGLVQTIPVLPVFKSSVSLSRSWPGSPLIALAVLFGLMLRPLAGPVQVPNSSFELPVTSFVDPRVDAWQKSAKPSWYNESGGFTWDQLSGVFANQPVGASNYIDNLAGNQALFLFALPEVAVFQDGDASSGTNSVPDQAFNAKFNVGRTYTLTAGVIGGGGGMTNGATLQLSLYYRDGTNRVEIAATTITNSPDLFPTTTHFVDFQVTLPTVKPTDPWAGRNIGLQILSTATQELSGGYWDVDNVRLLEGIGVPNGSFEFPVTTFADPRVDNWQKSPKPDWYSEASGFTWDQLTGVFANPPVGSTNRLDNLDGNQGLFLFAVPQVALFQDYSSVSGTNASPDQAFNATFDPGLAYTLTVGVVGGGGGMTNGVTLALSLYYRQGTNLITVAATTVTNTLDVFPTTTHLQDFQVHVPTVKPNDPWAGQRIGIQLLSTTAPERAGGYWDLDNVRLSAAVEAQIELSILQTGTDVQLSWPSEAGLEYQVKMSDDLYTWTNSGPPINGTGNNLSTSVPKSGSAKAFFMVVASPALGAP